MICFPEGDDFTARSLSFVRSGEGEGKEHRLAPVVGVFHLVQGLGEEDHFIWIGFGEKTFRVRMES
ncbi:hypothetical protein [uncultured Algoriphagus sp.]|uniref:hypothetical protein n=1 Tax=uncultured Algoriphagus sp. TaxID=417365 RepID=UPI001065B2A5|nr:hypothetical protein [uncultured Algoriphagus sp.]